MYENYLKMRIMRIYLIQSIAEGQIITNGRDCYSSEILPGPHIRKRIRPGNPAPFHTSKCIPIWLDRRIHLTLRWLGRRWLDEKESEDKEWEPQYLKKNASCIEDWRGMHLNQQQEKKLEIRHRRDGLHLIWINSIQSINNARRLAFTCLLIQIVIAPQSEEVTSLAVIPSRYWTNFPSDPYLYESPLEYYERERRKTRVGNTPLPYAIYTPGYHLLYIDDLIDWMLNDQRKVHHQIIPREKSSAERIPLAPSIFYMLLHPIKYLHDLLLSLWEHFHLACLILYTSSFCRLALLRRGSTRFVDREWEAAIFHGERIYILPEPCYWPF